jgi:type VI secretion system protein ImpJ
MSVQKPLFWQQGLFLQPQHFQIQEQSFRGLLAPFGRFATPHFWGIGDLEIRKSALPNRILDVNRGAFLFPDGTWVELPGNAVIRARSFDESWAGPLKVYLGLKVWNDSGEKRDRRRQPGKHLRRDDAVCGDSRPRGGQRPARRGAPSAV